MRSPGEKLSVTTWLRDQVASRRVESPSAAAPSHFREKCVCVSVRASVRASVSLFVFNLPTAVFSAQSFATVSANRSTSNPQRWTDDETAKLGGRGHKEPQLPDWLGKLAERDFPTVCTSCLAAGRVRCHSPAVKPLAYISRTDSELREFCRDEVKVTLTEKKKRRRRTFSPTPEESRGVASTS